MEWERFASLPDLFRRAEAREEIVLMRNGHSAVRLMPVMSQPTPAEQAAMLEVGESVAKKKRRRRASATMRCKGSSAASASRWSDSGQRMHTGAGARKRRINFGDCFAYDAAKQNRYPFLYVARFREADVKSAL